MPFGKAKKRREWVKREGTFARGEITALKRHRLQDHPNTRTWEMTVRFTTADGRALTATQAVECLVWDPPEIGNSAPLRYDPDDPELWVWEDHPPAL